MNPEWQRGIVLSIAEDIIGLLGVRAMKKVGQLRAV